jgi:hypothetical protein
MEVVLQINKFKHVIILYIDQSQLIYHVCLMCGISGLASRTGKIQMTIEWYDLPSTQNCGVIVITDWLRVKVE